MGLGLGWSGSKLYTRKNFGYKIVSARYVADHDHEMEVMTGHYKEIAQTRCVSTRGA